MEKSRYRVVREVAEQMEGLENERDDALARALDWEQRAKVDKAHLGRTRKTTAEQITVLTRRIASSNTTMMMRRLTTPRSSASLRASPACCSTVCRGRARQKMMRHVRRRSRRLPARSRIQSRRGMAGPPAFLTRKDEAGSESERRSQMEVKALELRDRGTFIPAVCVRPVAANDEQRYLLRRDGYRADDTEHCIIVIKAQCRGVSYDPYNWADGSRRCRRRTNSSKATGQN